MVDIKDEFENLKEQEIDLDFKELIFEEGELSEEEESYALTRYDPLKAYLEEIKKYPLISPEEEYELAIRYYKNKDMEAAIKLVTSNLRLVVKIAMEYKKAYNNLMDLIQEGNIGLMQAIKKFDPYKGVKLSSYAAWWIRAYILRFILNNWRLVKIGTTQTQRRLFFNLSKEKARLEAMGIDPSPKKIAKQLGVEEEEVIDMDNRLTATDLSLNLPLSDDSKGTTRIDLLVDNPIKIDDALACKELNETFKQKLEEFSRTLTGKEKYIFENRLMADEPLTLQEIGDHFGITRERIRQIEKRLLEKLKKFLLKEIPEYFSE